MLPYSTEACAAFPAHPAMPFSIRPSTVSIEDFAEPDSGSIALILACSGEAFLKAFLRHGWQNHTGTQEQRHQNNFYLFHK